MSVRLEGRSRKTVVASFHSLRHTFVSLSANAGVPLPVVQSIVGHTSTARTRHYGHANEAVLRQAVDASAAIGTALGKREEGKGKRGDEGRSPLSVPHSPARCGSIPARLARLARLLAKELISEDEYAATRARILAEI